MSNNKAPSTTVHGDEGSIFAQIELVTGKYIDEITPDAIQAAINCWEEIKARIIDEYGEYLGSVYDEDEFVRATERCQESIELQEKLAVDQAIGGS